MLIDNIDRTRIKIPYRDNVENHMNRWRSGRNIFDIFEVELGSGTVGYGEQMINYTWSKSTEEDVRSVEGRNAHRVMWESSLGAGLQMALFDAVARHQGVPLYSLFGEKLRESVSLSWWAIDMPASDWVTEAERAVERGYDSLKLKARPWYDLREQVDALCGAVPEEFDIDLDFNETGLYADRSLPLLTALDSYPQINSFEGPIRNRSRPLSDHAIRQHEYIRESVDADIVLHYARPGADERPNIVCADVCDGFVVGGAVPDILDDAAVAAVADTPFWLQIAGSGLSAAFGVHLGAVLEEATLPAINTHQLYEQSILSSTSVDVDTGTVPVPDGPGIGVSVDPETLEDLEVSEDLEGVEEPPLVKTTWDGGPTVYVTSRSQLRELVLAERVPYFETGVSTAVVSPAASGRLERIYQDALDGPVVNP